MGRSRKTKNEVSGWDIISFFLLIFTAINLIINLILDLLKAFFLLIVKIVEWFKNKKNISEKQHPLKTKCTSVHSTETKINLYPKELETINDYINEQIIYSNEEMLRIENIVKSDLGRIVNIMYNDIKNLKFETEIDSLFDYLYYQKYMRVFFSDNINNAKKFMGKNVQIAFTECGAPDRYFDNDVANKLQFHLKALIEYKQLHLYDYYNEFISLRTTFFHHHYNDKNCIHDDIKDEIVKKEIYYTIDVFVTCACISKVIYIINRVNNIHHDSELYMMMKKMVTGIKDKDLIIKKIKPIYMELYNKEFGNIKTDYLITLFLEFLYDRVNEDEKNIEYKNYVCKEDIQVIVDNLITEKSLLKNRISIENNIIEELSSFQNYNVEDLINILSNMKNWYQKYNALYQKNKSMREKERFMSGNFEIEEQEFNEKYNLNNITTGAQFELYLENLFKELGYKVKHSGKAGDQGADLILKYGEKIYVVQAKYYSSKLDNTPVQEIVGAIKYYNANQGIVITNNSFTKGAENLAKANNVILIDGIELKKIVEQVFEEQTEDILEKYNP